MIGAASLRALSDPVGNAFRPIVADEIAAALDELRDDLRIVVVLADVEEFSYREIAEIVGCPIGTVMSRLHRARRALRKRLLEHAEHLGLGNVQEPAPVSLDVYRRDRSSN